MKKIACIVGNGKSRENLDLDRLPYFGTVFGCNAFYREFPSVDYLVAIDPVIIEEIKTSDFPQERFIVPIEERHYEPYDMHKSKFLPRSNAGMAAMYEAIDRGFNHLFCFGFDFLVVDDAIATSNMFDGTNGYGPETRASLNDTRARMRFLAYTIETNPEIKFTFCYPKGLTVYTPMHHNVSLDTYERLFP